MDTPGSLSRAGMIFAFMHKDKIPRVCDYVFDAKDGEGVVVVMSGWYDPYGGRGNASKTFLGKPEPLPGGGWRVGEAELWPALDLQGFAPALTRAKAASYAYSDSRSKADPASI
jgi:hypothetical protein